MERNISDWRLEALPQDARLSTAVHSSKPCQHGLDEKKYAKDFLFF